MYQQTLAFTMNTIQWTIQAEYWLTESADNRDEILDNYAANVIRAVTSDATRITQHGQDH